MFSHPLYGDDLTISDLIEIHKAERMLDGLTFQDERHKADMKQAWNKLLGTDDVEVDPEDAVKLLKQCVKRLDHEAAWMLGVCYEFGIGCEQSMEAAKVFYYSSAQDDDQIGKMLLRHSVNGSGVLSVRWVLEGNYKDPSILEKFCKLIKLAPWKALDLEGSHIGDKGIEMLAPVLKTKSTLTKLRISHNNIGVKGAIALCRHLSSNTTLTSLHLSNSIGIEGARELSALIMARPTLKELDIRETRTGPRGMSIICDAVKNNRALTSLDLSSNSLGDGGTRSVADVLRVNSTLTKLNLSSNGIGEEGARILSQALRENHTLIQINLHGNSIGDGGRTILNEVEKTNKKLKISFEYEIEHDEDFDEGPDILDKYDDDEDDDDDYGRYGLFA